MSNQTAIEYDDDFDYVIADGETPPVDEYRLSSSVQDSEGE